MREWGGTEHWDNSDEREIEWSGINRETQFGYFGFIRVALGEWKKYFYKDRKFWYRKFCLSLTY